MKTIHLIGLLAIILAVFTSCKDEEEGPSTPDITGYWEGRYDFVYDFAVLFRSNGTARVYDRALVLDTALAAKGEGVYTISDSVRIIYSYGSGSNGIAGKLNDDATEMTGTFGDDGATGGEGPITLTKQ